MRDKTEASRRQPRATAFTRHSLDSPATQTKTSLHFPAQFHIDPNLPRGHTGRRHPNLNDTLRRYEHFTTTLAGLTSQSQPIHGGLRGARVLSHDSRYAVATLRLPQRPELRIQRDELSTAKLLTTGVAQGWQRMVQAPTDAIADTNGFHEQGYESTVPERRRGRRRWRRDRISDC